MAENGEKRSKTSHRTPGQESRHWQEYGKKHKPENRKRKRARRMMEKLGRVRKHDGKDVDHKRPLRQGGSNSPDNLAVVSRAKNRGWRRK